ncbi:ATP-binding protein [Trichocoleus sp. FACHB-90]|uniref:ATP-binding protein n=1 Tax=Cyanophyceae TaxID=3028117 RepID=UPI001682F4B3|nr:ATP-binding protein [Trichocoleus sp. FACHB-90]MBD1930073.1 ATP-binding protein [Trichocoleus sp. FACHB-90]
MKLQELGLLTDSWSRVVSVQSQLLERAATLGWIDRNFAAPRNLPVFLWNLGQRKFKQLKHSGDACYIQSNPICDTFDLPGIDYLQVLDFIVDYDINGVFVVENLQSLMVLTSTSDSLSRESAQKLSSQLVNIFYEFKVSYKQKYLLLLGTDGVELAAGLAGIIPEVWKPLPTLKELNCFLSRFLPTLAQLSAWNTEFDIDSLSVAASGLTFEEIKIGLRLGVNRNDGNETLLKQFLLDYKVERLRGYGLEFIGKPNVPDFGGLDRLKEALKEVKSDYSPKARESNIPLPKGWLLVGPPGTGKTLAAKVSARELGFPLISVDVGAVSSEGAAYLKRLIDRVEACAPAVVYFDEFDKLFAASSNTGEDASSRALLGLLLTWLQEKQSITFVVATLNRLKALPPELTRVGRFDEIFYVGFPQAVERKQILSLHASRFDERYKHGDGPLTQSEWKITLAKTVNCTGAELQRIVEKAARKLFHEGRPVQIGMKEILEQREAITPLYVRDPDRVIAIENEARYICRPASSEDNSIYAPPITSFWGELSNDQ